MRRRRRTGIVCRWGKGTPECAPAEDADVDELFEGDPELLQDLGHFPRVIEQRGVFERGSGRGRHGGRSGGRPRNGAPWACQSRGLPSRRTPGPSGCAPGDEEQRGEPRVRPALAGASTRSRAVVGVWWVAAGSARQLRSVEGEGVHVVAGRGVHLADTGAPAHVRWGRGAARYNMEERGDGNEESLPSRGGRARRRWPQPPTAPQRQARLREQTGDESKVLPDIQRKRGGPRGQEFAEAEAAQSPRGAESAPRTHEAEEALALLVVLAGHAEVALRELLSLLGVPGLRRRGPRFQRLLGVCGSGPRGDRAWGVRG